MRTALRFQDWVRVGKTLLAQFAWQNNAFFFLLSRINPSASGQVFVCFVKFSSNFLVFSCSSEILPKLPSGILTATSRL